MDSEQKEILDQIMSEHGETEEHDSVFSKIPDFYKLCVSPFFNIFFIV